MILLNKLTFSVGAFSNNFRFPPHDDGFEVYIFSLDELFDFVTFSNLVNFRFYVRIFFCVRFFHCFQRSNNHFTEPKQIQTVEHRWNDEPEDHQNVRNTEKSIIISVRKGILYPRDHVNLSSTMTCLQLECTVL